MSWGTIYKHEGYLIRIRKDEVENRINKCNQNIENTWQKILAYMAATPPAYAKTEDGVEYPYPEYLTELLEDLKDYLEGEVALRQRLEDCNEAMKEDPDNVTED